MTSITILFLQSLLISLQVINAGISTLTGLPPIVPFLISAVVGGFQYFVQNLGNMSMPPAKVTTKVVTDVAVPATADTPAATVQTTTVKTEPVSEKPVVKV